MESLGINIGYVIVQLLSLLMLGVPIIAIAVIVYKFMERRRKTP